MAASTSIGSCFTGSMLYLKINKLSKKRSKINLNTHVLNGFLSALEMAAEATATREGNGKGEDDLNGTDEVDGDEVARDEARSYKSIP